MSNFVTTNIRISEEDYLALKDEAARKRVSLSAVIREKIGEPSPAKPKVRSREEVARIMAQTRSFAKRNAKKLKGFDVVKALREMRYEGK